MTLLSIVYSTYMKWEKKTIQSVQKRELQKKVTYGKTWRKKQARMKFEYGEWMLTQVHLLCNFIEWQLPNIPIDFSIICRWFSGMVYFGNSRISLHFLISFVYGSHFPSFSNGRVRISFVNILSAWHFRSAAFYSFRTWNVEVRLHSAQRITTKLLRN